MEQHSGRNRPAAGGEDTRLVRENRVLRGVVFVVIGLLGPLFTAGYAVGRLAAPRGRPETAVADEPRAAAAPTAAPAVVSQPAADQVYLQLMATPEHRPVIERLRRNGFQAVASQVPKSPGLHRVLVGPLAAGEVSETRVALQRKGFPGKSAIRRRLSIQSRL